MQKYNFIYFSLLLYLLALSSIKLNHTDSDNDDKEDNRFCLTDTLISDTTVEGIVNIQCHHFCLMHRFTSCQGQVLVKEFKRVCNC